ncbi:MAG TPA: FAD-dependent oxidoreductase [Gaiellales bacterium]|nr:FAD-dependent oxidoreductase [Gaiellales bacterium]
MSKTKPRIVIVGGGFAGLYAAMYLDRTLARSREAEVVLISRENFILFTPMLHEVAAGDLHPADIVNPLRRILRHVTIVQAEVDAIDLRTRTVSCVAGLGDVRREFEFDHLLLALGSETNFFDMAGVRDWASRRRLPVVRWSRFVTERWGCWPPSAVTAAWRWCSGSSFPGSSPGGCGDPSTWRSCPGSPRSSG